jgi:antitoxin YefM
MEAISYTQARKKLATLMDKVCDNHDHVIITRQKREPVVVMSLQDYNSLEETSYLLKSPKNAARLNTAVSDFKEIKNFHKITIE